MTLCNTATNLYRFDYKGTEQNFVMVGFYFLALPALTGKTECRKQTDDDIKNDL